MYFRTPNGKVWHLLFSDNATKCGKSTKFGYKFRASDLPSGERIAKVCKACRS